MNVIYIDPLKSYLSSHEKILFQPEKVIDLLLGVKVTYQYPDPDPYSEYGSRIQH